jgi:hypothetical protein
MIVIVGGYPSQRPPPVPVLEPGIIFRLRTYSTNNHNLCRSQPPYKKKEQSSIVSYMTYNPYESICSQ